MKASSVAGAALATVVALGSYQLVVLPRLRVWGATDDELAGPWPGDALVAHPRWESTLAVTVKARPESIWPWLAQIGYQRGGLYSYDWLDRLFGILDRPSADQILPQFQAIQSGDLIPLGAGPDWPVAAVAPNRSLVLAPDAPGFHISWAFVLDPIGLETTRLLSRARASFALSPATVVPLSLLDPTAFLMTRRMLLGIKARAERLERELAERSVTGDGRVVEAAATGLPGLAGGVGSTATAAG